MMIRRLAQLAVLLAFPSLRDCFLVRKTLFLGSQCSPYRGTSTPKESEVDVDGSNCQHRLEDRGCPFAMSFPRFRIDLRSVKSPDRRVWSLPMIDRLQAAMAKASFERSFRQEQYLWVEGVDGVSALAVLWRQVSKLISKEVPASSDTMLIGLPDCESRVVQQWIDIIEWARQNVEGMQSVEIEVLDEVSPVPAVRLVRIGSPTETERADSAHLDTSIIEKRTKAWVRRILVEETICPFTKSEEKSGQGLSDLGIPVGKIAYHASKASPNNLCLLMSDFWEAVEQMILAGPSGKDGISSILLAAPAFDDDFAFWAGPVFAMLEAGVVAAGAEKNVGVVCFHPQYATPDGTSWPGFGHMHSVPRLQKWLKENDPSQDLSLKEVAAGGAFQRRTPHATINVLRADQLEAAEGRRTSGSLYADNIKKLVGKPDGIGSDRLLQDLERERRLT